MVAERRHGRRAAVDKPHPVAERAQRGMQRCGHYIRIIGIGFDLEARIDVAIGDDLRRQLALRVHVRLIVQRVGEGRVFRERGFGVAGARVIDRERYHYIGGVLACDRARAQIFLKRIRRLAPARQQILRGEDTHQKARALIALTGRRIDQRADRRRHLIALLALGCGQRDLHELLGIGRLVDLQAIERFVSRRKAFAANQLLSQGAAALRAAIRAIDGAAAERAQAIRRGVGITFGPRRKIIALLRQLGDRDAVDRLAGGERSARRCLGVLGNTLKILEHAIIGIEPLLRIEIVLLLRERLAGLFDRILRGLLRIAACRQQQRCNKKIFGAPHLYRPRNCPQGFLSPGRSRRVP